MGRPGGSHPTSDQRRQRPMEEAACGKIIVRLRPVLKHELAGGEELSASATERGYATKRCGGRERLWLTEDIVKHVFVGRRRRVCQEGTRERTIPTFGAVDARLPLLVDWSTQKT